MDIWFIFEQTPLVLGSLLGLVAAVFLLVTPTGKQRAQLLWLLFTLAMVGALAQGEVSDILFSPEWTLPFYAVALTLILILPIWGFALPLSTETFAILLAAYFIFLDNTILLSNALGVVLYLFLWLFFLHGVYLTLKQWMVTPAGKEA